MCEVSLKPNFKNITEAVRKEGRGSREGAQSEGGVAKVASDTQHLHITAPEYKANMVARP